MNDSFGVGGFDATQGQTGSSAVKKAEGIAPVVIKQILESNDEGISLWGIGIGIVSFVAIVRNVDHSSTKITYRLEDHTGQIDAHFWLEEGDTMNAPQVVVNAYARVYGSVRTSGGAKTIMIFRLEPMANINELTNHLLEVLNARFKAEEASKVDVSGSGGSNAEFTGSFGAAMANGTAVTSNVGANPHGLNPKQLAVFEAIRAHKSTTGISLQQLQKRFAHISETEMASITEFMTAEGHIYTSIDAEHFMSSEY